METKPKEIGEILHPQKRPADFEKDETELGRAEESLPDNEVSLQAVSDTIPQPVCFIDSQGYILAANKAMAKKLGRDGTSLAGLNSYDLLPASVSKQQRAKVEEAVRKRSPISLEETNGQRHYLNLISPAFLNGGAVSRIAVISLDITARIRAEEAVRQSEEIYRTVVDRVSDGILILQDKIIQFANPHLAEMAGYRVDEIIGRPFINFLSPDSLPELLRIYESRASGEEAPAKYEICIRKKNGDPLFVEVNSSLIPFRNKLAGLVIVRNFSQRKRAEKLKESIFHISEAAISSESLDELFRSIHRVIADLMPAQNFYIALYDSANDILSFPYFVDECDQPDEPRKPGRGLTEYVLRTGKPLLASPEVFAKLQESGEVELVGAPSIDWLGVPLTIGGNTFGVLVVQSYTKGVRYGEEEMDILKFVSDQIAMAVHRKRAEAQIRASLQEKDVLLKEVHHRVKNNMQVISSLLNLQSHRIPDPDVLEMFKESQRRIRSMALIHERLYQSSDLSRVEFSQYLHNLAAHLFQSYQVDSSRVRLRMDTEEVLLNINTAIPCGLIVNELVSNALKHAFPNGKGGELGIALHKAAGDGYVLRVWDDGVGFPKELDFRRTETLGMQIVVTLVEQIDGKLEIGQEGGTTFTLEFNETRPHKRA